jgi:hypothetical protein
MEKNNKATQILKFILDTVIYTLAYMFLSIFAFSALYFIYHLAKDEIIVRYYIYGILIIISAGLSILVIENYNKNYNKNDSDTSKRQNDCLFEEDIRREEGRYSDRRDVE